MAIYLHLYSVCGGYSRASGDVTGRCVVGDATYIARIYAIFGRL
ncbi:hypothetical protein [Yoonia sp. SS1-5]|uniref:Uncharacterized protein n=1 Tax=Yoonia rhodophyticola TaxID=3137370 RepID=A0AAN0NKW5_9RHOB